MILTHGFIVYTMLKIVMRRFKFCKYFQKHYNEDLNIMLYFYPTDLKGCQGIVFTHGVRMGGWAVGRSLSGLYLGNCKV